MSKLLEFERHVTREEEAQRGGKGIEEKLQKSVKAFHALLDCGLKCEYTKQDSAGLSRNSCLGDKC